MRVSEAVGMAAGSNSCIRPSDGRHNGSQPTSKSVHKYAVLNDGSVMRMDGGGEVVGFDGSQAWAGGSGVVRANSERKRRPLLVALLLVFLGLPWSSSSSG